MRLTHSRAVFLMVAVTLMWSTAGVVTRQLEHARSFEVTFWRSFFTVLSLLVILPFFQGRGVFGKIRHAGAALWISGLCWSVMFTACMVALTLTSVANVLVTMAQEDMKKLIAYSSVAHMGFVTMGIFSGNVLGVQGAVFQMVSHGLISGALFLCVGVVYDRMHTREIAFYGGLVNRMPWYAAVFMLFTMGNVGLPATSGFVGEILTLTGVYGAPYGSGTWTALFAASGVILSAVYALSLYRRVVFGEITNQKLLTITDLDWREVAIFAPLIVGTLALGIYPQFVLGVTQASAERLVDAWRAAVGS